MREIVEWSGDIGRSDAALHKDRRARYHTLTAAGREQLAAERAEFDRLCGAIQRVLGAT